MWPHPAADIDTPLSGGAACDGAMRVLHVLDHSLPLQSGYTFRTRAILKAQLARGYQVAGVTGPRKGAGDRVEGIDGLTFYRARPTRSGPT